MFSNRIKNAQRALAHATTWAAWRDAAEDLDRLEENQAWRDDPRSPHYDHELIQGYLNRMVTYREMHDFKALRDLIEQLLHRSLGDLSNQALYEYSYLGTKNLIEAFYAEIERTFYWLCDAPVARARSERRICGFQAARCRGGDCGEVQHRRICVRWVGHQQEYRNAEEPVEQQRASHAWRFIQRHGCCRRG